MLHPCRTEHPTEFWNAWKTAEKPCNKMQHDRQGKEPQYSANTLIIRDLSKGIRTTDLRIYGPARRDTPGLLMAPDEASWEALHEVLLG
jgi:hypothetical protein